MAKTAPYFPFYVDDWLDSDEVFDMGLECEGAYCRLLAIMWIDLQLPTHKASEMEKDSTRSR